jgi:phage-related protein (TIGR01555 family)
MAKRTTRKPSTPVQVIEPEDYKPAIPEGMSKDAFSNPAARIGAMTPSLLEGSNYPILRLTRNYMLLQSLYRDQWIIRRCVDLIPEAMTFNWIRLVTQQKPPEIDAFERVIRRHQVKAKITEALSWARLFGGSAAVIVIKGHEDILDQPLRLQDVDLDSFGGLMIFDRWAGIAPSSEMIENYDMPGDTDLPAYYQVNTQEGATFQVHASRVLRFVGCKLPRWERNVEQGWGASIVEEVYAELNKRNNTSWAVANMMFRANILSLQQKGQENLLAMGTPQQQKRLDLFLETMNQLLSSQSLVPLGIGEELKNSPFTFGGLSEILQVFMLDICAASGPIPMSKMFGRNSTGLSATGEGDEKNWEALIQSKQAFDLEPQLDKLFDVVAMSCWGEIPNDFAWRFNPIRQIDAKDREELIQKRTTVITEAFNAGIISQQLALMEMADMKDETGAWSNITPELIASADVTVSMPGGDVPPLESDNPAEPELVK